MKINNLLTDGVAGNVGQVGELDVHFGRQLLLHGVDFDLFSLKKLILKSCDRGAMLPPE